jgi:UDP-2,3-diacylglucosamine pyrophosphatase LpxH
MTVARRLSQVFASSQKISFDDTSKIIIMSDCHRGYGNHGDNFLKNQNLFYTALRYYYNEGYTYIEIGDGDELWENRYLSPIITNYNDIFLLMSKFYKKDRFHMLFGNHDIVKKNEYVKSNILQKYFDEHHQKYISLFPHINIYEGLILNYKKTKDKIFLIHGHQGDFLNDTIWKFARLLVRYLWKPLELIGVRNPTSAATNDKKKKVTEKRLIDWTIKNKQMLIAGHTHRAMFPQIGEHLYFNDGCCINPHYITGIEINDGSISLIKWMVKTRDNRNLFIDREILIGPIKLKDYFNSTSQLK